MLSCKDVTHLVATDELADAGWWRRTTVRFHLLMCRNCRLYTAQMRALGRAARELWRIEVTGAAGVEPAAMIDARDLERLASMERRILAGVNGGPDRTHEPGEAPDR